MSTDSHSYQKTWSRVIDLLIQRSLAEKILQEAHNLVIQASERPVKDKMKIETKRSKAATPCRHVLSAMVKGNYYVCSLKPSICDEMLKELRHIPLNVCLNLIYIRITTAAKVCSQCTLMEHAQLRQSTNTRESKKGLSTFMQKIEEVLFWNLYVPQMT